MFKLPAKKLFKCYLILFGLLFDQLLSKLCELFGPQKQESKSNYIIFSIFVIISVFIYELINVEVPNI